MRASDAGLTVVWPISIFAISSRLGPPDGQNVSIRHQKMK